MFLTKNITFYFGERLCLLSYELSVGDICVNLRTKECFIVQNEESITGLNKNDDDFKLVGIIKDERISETDSFNLKFKITKKREDDIPIIKILNHKPNE